MEHHLVNAGLLEKYFSRWSWGACSYFQIRPSPGQTCLHRLGGPRKNLCFGISFPKEMALHIRVQC